MSPLEQRIERDQSLGNGERAIVTVAAPVVRDEIGEGLHGAFVKTAPLGRQPLFEGLLAQAEAAQQLAAVKRHRRLQRLRRALARQPLELKRVGLHGLGLEPDGIRIGDQGVCARQRLAQARQCLAQARARLLFGAAVPERGRQMLARARHPRRQREVGEERPALAGGQLERETGAGAPDLQAAEHPDGEFVHARIGSTACSMGAAYTPGLTP